MKVGPKASEHEWSSIALPTQVFPSPKDKWKSDGKEKDIHCIGADAHSIDAQSQEKCRKEKSNAIRSMGSNGSKQEGDGASKNNRVRQSQTLETASIDQSERDPLP